MIHSEWKDAVINIAVDDDLSAEVNLGRAYDTLLVVIPTITSSTVAVHVAEKSGGTYYPLYLTSTADGDDDPVVASASTGGITWVVPLGGFQFIKIATGSAQLANRTFRVCGVRS